MQILKLAILAIVAITLSACSHHHRHPKKRVVVTPVPAYIVVNKPIKGRECWKVPRGWRCQKI